MIWILLVPALQAWTIVIVPDGYSISWPAFSPRALAINQSFIPDPDFTSYLASLQKTEARRQKPKLIWSENNRLYFCLSDIFKLSVPAT